MQPTLSQEMAALWRLSLADLHRRYVELHGEPAHSSHKPHLVKRIAWRMQALAEGDLSQRARRRAAELANDADLRLTPPRPKTSATAPAATPPPTSGEADHRLPRPGTVLTRKYKGGTLQVKVLAQGFDFAGTVYPSLSAVAKAITGSHCNGFLFFKLIKKGGKR